MKNLNLKIILGSLYLAILSIFLYFLFSKFNIEDISSIKIIQSNMGELNQIKDNNLILIIFKIQYKVDSLFCSVGLITLL